MNNSHSENSRIILTHFPVHSLKLILEDFLVSTEVSRTELEERVLELFDCRLNGHYSLAYKMKQFLRFHIISAALTHRLSVHEQQIARQSEYQLLRSLIPEINLAHALNIYPINSDEYRLQYLLGSLYISLSSYFSLGPQTAVPSQLPTNQQNTSNLVLNPLTSGNSYASATIPSPSIVANYKFKKLPFYDVIKDIRKPTRLDYSDRCTLSRFFKGTSKCEFHYTMSNEEVELIAMNRDTSNGKCDYLFDCQIRICQLDQIVRTEVTDDLPNGLCVRINGITCPLPPFAPTKRPGIEARRTDGPINCAQFLRLCPLVSNVITINWISDGKKYALAMSIVKQLSVDTLIKKLQDNKVRSSEETKNDIIKRLTVVDPDLASTSYNFSLVCPLSTVRMEIPAKSIHCDHLQCFDARIFILMNEKRPKWMCPTCHKSCSYDEIQIDGYFLEIVESLALRDDIKEIGLLDDGSWVIPEKNKDTKNTNGTIDNTVIELDDFEDST